MEEQINKALEILSKGGIILYPTDTIWGIGCDATNASAVDKIFKLKMRKKDNSLIILLDSMEKLTNYLEELHVIAIELINQTDKPLTIVYPNAKKLPKSVCGEDGSVAIRIAKNEFCKELIKRFDKPIVSTSANISGHSSPVSFKSISSEVLDGVDYVVENLEDTPSYLRPSTIIRIEENGIFNIVRR